MAIDLPPALPPQPADSARILTTKAENSSYIGGKLGDIEVRVFGNRLLDKQKILSVIAGSESPSDAVKELARAYYEAGYLWVQLHYYRVEDTVGVIVSQSIVSEVQGDERIAGHFQHLVGDTDPTIAEFDTARVLASLKAERIGQNFSVGYKALGSQRIAMVFDAQAQNDYSSTDFIVELNNKGSRYLGRYFGLIGAQYRNDSGTEFSAAYQSAFIEWGESEDGKSLNQYSLSVDHPFSYGLYGLDLSYVDYARDPEGQFVQPGTCTLLLFCSSPTITTAELDLEAEIQRYGLRGEQVLYSDTRQRLRLKERVEYIDSYIEEKQTDNVLLDERYPVVELGVHYTTRLQNEKAYLSTSLDARFGLSSSGTLDRYGGFQQVFLAQNPSAASAPNVTPAARTGEFIALRPELNYQYPLAARTVVSATVKGQFANEQLPEQDQFVLGGMDSLAAYLPGVLIGDEGVHLKLELSHGFAWGDIKFLPSVFIEQGQSWYNNTDTDLGDAQKVTDAGIALTVDLTHGLTSYWVMARNISDDVVDEELLEASEADFFWRLRLEI